MKIILLEKPHLPVAGPEQRQLMLCPAQGFQNTAFHIVLEAKEAAGLTILNLTRNGETLQSPGDNHPRSGLPDPGPKQSLGRVPVPVPEPVLPGRYTVSVYSKQTAIQHLDFEIWDARLIHEGPWFEALATDRFLLFATPAAVRLYCRQSGRHLGELYLPPQQQMLSICSAGQDQVLSLTREGYLHIFSLLDAGRTTFRLTPGPIGRARLLAETAGTCLCEIDSFGAWRLRVSPGAEMQVLEQARAPDHSDILKTPLAGGGSLLFRPGDTEVLLDYKDRKTRIGFPFSIQESYFHLRSLPPISGGEAPPELAYINGIHIGLLSLCGERFLEKNLEQNYNFPRCKGLRLIETTQDCFCLESHSGFHQITPLSHGGTQMGSSRDTLDLSRYSTAISFAHANIVYAVGSHDGKVRLFTLPEHHMTTRQVHSVNPGCITLDSENQGRACGDVLVFFDPTGRLYTAGMDYRLKCFQLEIENNQLELLLQWELQTEGNVQDACFDGLHLACTTPVELLLIDPDEGRQLGQCFFQGEYLDAIAYCPFSRQFLIGDWGGTIHYVKHTRPVGRWRVCNSAIFNLQIISENTVLVLTEDHVAYWIDPLERRVLGSFEYHQAAGCRRGYDLISPGERPCLLYRRKHPRVSNPWSAWLFPLDRIGFESGRVFLTPLDRVLDDYPPLLVISSSDYPAAQDGAYPSLEVRSEDVPF